MSLHLSRRSSGSPPTPTPLGLNLRGGVRGVLLAAPVALALSGAFGGVRGLVSSAVGVLLVAAFFLVSLVLVERANTVGPGLTLPVALTVYGVKVVFLGVIVFGTDWAKHLNGAAFAWSVVGATLAWLVSQAVSVWRTRMPYVVPSESSPSAPPQQM
jgi:ATP synthase protein I